MITLDPTQHEAIRQDSELAEGLGAWALIAILLDGIEKLLVEDRHVLHSAVVTSRASVVCVHLPIKSRAGTLLAEIACEWANIEEADQREELADAVLEGGSRQAPLVICLQGETCLGGTSGSLLVRN